MHLRCILPIGRIFWSFVDKDFNNKDRIAALERRVARFIGILSKLVHAFSQNIMLQLYHAVLHPIILYSYYSIII